jgi:ferredoxin
VRAVTTRAVVALCRDRLARWRVLRELAGTEVATAAPATEAVPAAAAVSAVRAEPAAGVAEPVAAREAAISKLLYALLDLEGAAPAPPLPVAATSAPAPAAGPAAAPAGPPPAGPYIDSALCTSCNECTNLNSRMFKYDANKQAHIADAAAGTFAELVKAAEKCPARCIHPGAPRAGDRTATDKLVARAARFN